MSLYQNCFYSHKSMVKTFSINKYISINEIYCVNNALCKIYHT